MPPLATIQTVRHVDDLDPQVVAEHPDVEFGLDGKTYRLDLGAANLARLREVLAPYIAAGRRAGRTSRPPVRPATPASDPEQNRAIRAWAARQGMTVAGNGRIPAHVVEAPAAEEEPELTARTGRPSAIARIRARVAEQTGVPEEHLMGGEPPAAPRFPTKTALNRAVREWAQGRGVTLAPRGKVSQDVMDQWMRVHGQPILEAQ